MAGAGAYYEAQAARFLQDRGLRILQSNYHCRCGEIDLIARHGQYLVFVEVRSRGNPRFTSAAASVDRRKQRKLLRTAQFFLQQHPQLAQLPCRFDVIAFEPRQSRASPDWIAGAFTN
ncbi:YraN family protein [Seongchinamella sediminis]|uniref:UPF0102 protein DWB85_00755 n=1 Tax=Seongchinamella sediminis TaxID=2283635 RepID=A0A3L7E1J5_9GAMM|nr:YraN family protein [Seongchinamella sediminis]RLQ23718.1 YraN family protein [Seongchinamella sediminis]